MKTQHTSGPWIYAFGAVYQGDNPDTVEDNTGRLLLADRENPHTMPTERDANCRLAAAAPDLLEACKAFYHVECEKFSSDPFNRDSQPDSPVQKAWLLAVAAIAKAEGREGAAVD